MRGFGSFSRASILAMAGGKSPWGGNGNTGDGNGTPSGDGDTPPAGDSGDPAPPSAEQPRRPRNPWQAGDSEDAGRRSASIEDIFRNRGGKRPGGSGGGGIPRLPQRPDGKSWLPLVAVGLAGLWVLTSSTHQLSSSEQGVVTTFGKYSRTIGPGVSLTLPWPVESVTRRDVTGIQQINIPDSEGEKLVLTSDQNLVDLSYQVRWNIKDLKQFTFELNDPESTVQEVAEAAMRASVAEMPLSMIWGGQGRGELEANVRRRMQGVLDAYRSGVQVLGVEIKKADPPAKVADAFQQVNIAQQNAQRDMNQAQAWAQQKIAQAEGEAAAFDKVYGQYKLAPDVTRRRLYYETMERVLSNNDKVVLESNGVTPYLPLPEVQRKPAPEATASAGGQ